MSAAELERAGEARREADAKRAEAMEALARLVVRAKSEGMGKSEIARRSGLSRPTVDAILKR